MNNGFGPLLVRRKNRASYCGTVILLVSSSTLFGYLAYLEKNESFDVAMYLLCMSVLAMFLGELLRRSCLLAEEVYHKRERYEGNWRKVVYKVFSFQNPYIGDTVMAFFFGLFVFLAYHFYQEIRDVISGEEERYFLLLFQNITIVPIIGYLAGIKVPADVERDEMNERHNKNLADGLAWSYYFGYLKLVLPHLEKHVQRSTQELRENLCPLKLLILLPKNCYCYETLDKCDPRIEPHRNLPVLAVNRAGIQKRQYHHTVYKITITEDDHVDEKKYEGIYYCLLEYATPLMSLYDMSKLKTAVLSEEERLNQVKIFFNKLTEILDEDPECKGKYMLIPLADTCDNLALTIVKSIKNSPVDVFN